MADEINKTADWEPGTLDKTRRNIGQIDEKEAATMAKKLGGQVLYERTTSSAAASHSNGATHGQGRIVRSTGGGAGGSAGGSSGSKPNTTYQAPRRHIREDLPTIPKKLNSAIDKLMMGINTKPSILEAAPCPDMAYAPKALIFACTTMFPIEITEF